MALQHANDETFADMVNGKYLAHYDPKAFYASLFSFWHEYNLPVIFMPDADYTGMFIRGYFQYYLSKSNFQFLNYHIKYY